MCGYLVSLLLRSVVRFREAEEQAEAERERAARLEAQAITLQYVAGHPS